MGYGLGAVVNVGLEQGAGPSYWLVAGVINGLSVGLGSILLQVFLERSHTTALDLQTRPPSRGLRWWHFWRHVGIRNGLRAGLLLGLSAGVGAGVAFGVTDEMAGFGLRTALIEGLGAGINIGVNVALVSGLSAGLLSPLLSRNLRAISPADELRWSWRSLRRSLFAWRHLSRILGVSVFAGLLYGLRLWPLYVIYGQDSGTSWLDYGLAAGTTLGLISWLLLGLFEGVASETIADEQRVAPNQGIHRSARNGLVLGLISAGIAWLITGMFAAGYGWAGELITGLSVGLLAGLLNGGLAALRHSVLRFLLWRADSIPRNYPHFLDYAAERILLRKVGGGYIFVHRLLLEYFASLNSEMAPREVTGQEEPALPISCWTEQEREQ